TRVEGFFGGDRVYDLRSAQQNANSRPVLGQDETRKGKKPGDVDVFIDSDALAARDGMDKEALQRAYDQQRKAEQNPQWNFQEDLSDMIATESRKRRKRDEERRNNDGRLHLETDLPVTTDTTTLTSNTLGVVRVTDLAARLATDLTDRQTEIDKGPTPGRPTGETAEKVEVLS
ncbi:hypothetical protein LTR93_011952, partial [Exophiala xenobiotica]